MEILTWLLRMTFVEIGVIPYLFLAMPLVAAVSRRESLSSALGLVALALVTPTLVLVWAQVAFDQGRHHQWMGVVPLFLVMAGFVGTVICLRRDRPRPPAWAVISYAFGSLVIWGMALFVSSMAITGDYV
jgi:hypothetical protein